jgi:hypothetical protein
MKSDYLISIIEEDNIPEATTEWWESVIEDIWQNEGPLSVLKLYLIVVWRDNPNYVRAITGGF